MIGEQDKVMFVKIQLMDYIAIENIFCCKTGGEVQSPVDLRTACSAKLCRCQQKHFCFQQNLICLHEIVSPNVIPTWM
jgi:hypothetical protein